MTDKYTKTIWINSANDYSGGSDKWPGTESLPFKSLCGAYEKLGITHCAASKHKIKTESFFDKILGWFK